MVISIYNRKGGTGKTTSSVMISSILANEFGKKVLLIDLDNQNDTRTTFSIPNLDEERNIWNCLFNFDKLKATRIHGNFSFVCGSDHMDDMSFFSFSKGDDLKLKSLLDRYRPEKHPEKSFPDIIILDCPPSKGTIARNALNASDFLIIPGKPGNMDLNGAVEALAIMNEEKKKGNTSCQLLGVLVTQLDARFAVHKALKDVYKENFKDLVFTDHIRMNAPLVEATSYAEDLGSFLKELKDNRRNFLAYEDYKNVISQMLERLP